MLFDMMVGVGAVVLVVGLSVCVCAVLFDDWMADDDDWW